MIVDAGVQNRPIYDFAEPLDLREVASDDPLIPEIVATRAFQRLKKIRFLGGIDYRLVRAPNGAKGNIRYTRYQHSLGVARLTLQYCKIRDVAPIDRRVLYVSALLHDIGHAPLSHSLEPIFKELFDLDHHRATEDIISGQVVLGRDLGDILRCHKVDIERVMALISGKESGFDGLFAGPINFDTIEGILRVEAYTKRKPNSSSPEAVTEAAVRRERERDRDTVDKFWVCKDQIYRCVMNSREGVLADFACQLFMKRHLDRVSPEDYFSTESQIFQKLPELKNLLTSRNFEAEVMHQLDRPIPFQVRSFFIDPSGDFFARQDNARYRQKRVDRVLMPRTVNVDDTALVKLDLFNDDGI